MPAIGSPAAGGGRGLRAGAHPKGRRVRAGGLAPCARDRPRDQPDRWRTGRRLRPLLGFFPGAFARSCFFNARSEVRRPLAAGAFPGDQRFQMMA